MYRREEDVVLASNCDRPEEISSYEGAQRRRDPEIDCSHRKRRKGQEEHLRPEVSPPEQCTHAARPSLIAVVDRSGSRATARLLQLTGGRFDELEVVQQVAVVALWANAVLLLLFRRCHHRRRAHGLGHGHGRGHGVVVERAEAAEVEAGHVVVVVVAGRVAQLSVHVVGHDLVLDLLRLLCGAEHDDVVAIHYTGVTRRK